MPMFTVVSDPVSLVVRGSALLFILMLRYDYGPYVSTDRESIGVSIITAALHPISMQTNHCGAAHGAPLVEHRMHRIG